MLHLCHRRRRQAGPVPLVVRPRPVYPVSTHDDHSSSSFVSFTRTMPNVPMSPPPSYEMLENDFLAASRPAPFYQQQYRSQQDLPAPQNTLRKKKSAWKSTVDLRPQRSGQPRPHQQGCPSGTNLPDRPAPSHFADCPIARGMNQGAAFCDMIAARLNYAISRQDGGGDIRDEDIEALTSGLMLDDSIFREGEVPRGHSNRDRRAQESQSKSGLINFKKSWLYANSRLPPNMYPYKVYVPTWQVICRAAHASAAAYTRPKGNENQEYIDADWVHGTKAMMMKSMPVDEKNLIVIAIRGSKWNVIDWWINFRPAPTQPIRFLDDEGNLCHAGFLHVARKMILPVATRLIQLLQQSTSREMPSLLITGHSAGGAVANLLYSHMMATSRQCKSELNGLTGFFKRVHCVTFGVPPVSLLRLQTPNAERHKKNIFVSFINEGDPVVRFADKQYLSSLARLIAAPAPSISLENSTKSLRQKASRQRLKGKDAQPAKQVAQLPTWPVPETTLVNGGRLVLLRKPPDQSHGVEAVCLTYEDLREYIFGDPAMHEMALYQRRIDELACAAITGRDEG